MSSESKIKELRRKIKAFEEELDDAYAQVVKEIRIEEEDKKDYRDGVKERTKEVYEKLDYHLAKSYIVSTISEKVRRRFDLKVKGFFHYGDGAIYIAFSFYKNEKEVPESNLLKMVDVDALDIFLINLDN